MKYYSYLVYIYLWCMTSISLEFNKFVNSLIIFCIILLYLVYLESNLVLMKIAFEYSMSIIHESSYVIVNYMRFSI